MTLFFREDIFLHFVRMGSNISGWLVGWLVGWFIYLFLAVLGLRLCARAFSSCGERGPLFIAVRGSLTIAASLVAEHRLQTRRLSSCGSRAQPLRGMWDLPGTRARTRVPCIGRWILNHCTTREAAFQVSYMKINCSASLGKCTLSYLRYILAILLSSSGS